MRKDIIMQILLTHDDMLNERFTVALNADYDEYVTYSVEYGANNYNDDMYIGTLEECCEYITNHIAKEDAARYGLQISEMTITSDGRIGSHYNINRNLDEIYDIIRESDVFYG